MKRLYLIYFFIIVSVCSAQNINWNTDNKDQVKFVSANLGYDYGLITQLGYHHLIHFHKPILVNVEYSMPMGNNLIDDFKFRFSGQTEVFNYQHFASFIKISGIFKRHETDLVRIAGIGTEIFGIVGYYKPKWHIATEFGIDKSILSHHKHSKIFEEYHVELKDGWYNSFGGYYRYGIQGSKSIGEKFDITFSIGATNAFGNDEDALIAKYFQIGSNIKL